MTKKCIVLNMLHLLMQHITCNTACHSNKKISGVIDCSTVTCVCCLVCSCLASPHLQLMLVSHLSLGIVPWNLGNAGQPAARNVTVRNTAGPVFHSVRCKF